MLVRTIGQIIRGQVLITVSAQARVSDAAAVMAEQGVGALIVTEGGHMVGILCDWDLETRSDAMGDHAVVADVMTPDPQTIALQESLATALGRMHAGGFSHLPVKEPGGNIVGLLAMKDIPVAYRMMVERFSAYKSLHTAA